MRRDGPRRAVHRPRRILPSSRRPQIVGIDPCVFILNVGWVEHLRNPSTLSALLGWFPVRDTPQEAPIKSSTHPTKFPSLSRARRMRPFSRSSRASSRWRACRASACPWPSANAFHHPARFVEIQLRGTRVMALALARAHQLVICLLCSPQFFAALPGLVLKRLACRYSGMLR